MSQFFKFTFNGKNYTAKADSRSTRSGFAHDIEVWDADYRDACKATCHYLNRTWESFRFETVLHKAIGELETEAVESDIYHYKRDNNVSRLPKGKKAEIEAVYHEEYKRALDTIVAL